MTQTVMGEIIPLVDPSDYKRVLKRIKTLWESGHVEFKSHALSRMKDRDIDTTDLQHLIRNGRISEHSRPKQFHRYKIEGKSVDGKKLGCIVEVNGNLIVVTVLPKQEGKR